MSKRLFSHLTVSNYIKNHKRHEKGKIYNFYVRSFSLFLSVSTKDCHTSNIQLFNLKKKMILQKIFDHMTIIFLF